MEIIEIENSKYVYARNIFGKYYIPYDLIHRPCPQIILKGGVWEYDTLKFIESEYKGGDIIHAGTFFGDFLPFLSKISKNYNVYAFEPVLENYKCSKLNLKLNNIKNVKLFNKTISSTNEKFFIKTKKDGILLGGASHVSSANNYDQLSDGIKIDDLFEKINKCSIIHLDIEGHETHALLGAKKIINHFKPLLILESAINNSIVKDLLILNKYKFIKKVNDNFILKSES